MSKVHTIYDLQNANFFNSLKSQAQTNLTDTNIDFFPNENAIKLSIIEPIKWPGKPFKNSTGLKRK